MSTPESELGVPIALRIVYPQRLGELGPCVDEIALAEARHSHIAARDRHLRHPPLVFRLAQEALRRLPRQARARRATGCRRKARNRRRIAPLRRQLPPRDSLRARTWSSTRRRRSLENASSPDPSRFETSTVDSPKRLWTSRTALTRHPPPCPPWRSPCRDGRSPPGRRSGGAPASPALPHHSIAGSIEPGLREMMGDQASGSDRARRVSAVRGAAVQRLAPALEQAVIGRVLDQRVLEAIGRHSAARLRRTGGRPRQAYRAPTCSASSL